VSPATAERLKATVKWFSLAQELIPTDGLVLAAVSGGADSMALLSLLHALSTELKFRVAVGHFDHQMRESGVEEQELVVSYARGLSLPVYSGTADVRAQVSSSDDTLEEGARRARYQFLTALADKIRATRIATGHTKSDQAETVLMRVLSGTGMRGLAGIPTRRGRIVRPLLCLSRNETLSYCESLGIPYVTDPTNRDTGILRNRVRLELLPLIENSYHPGVVANLLRLTQNSQDLIQSIRGKTDPLIEHNLRSVSTNEWLLNIAGIGSLDDTAIVVLLGDVIADRLGCDMDLGRVHYEQVIRLIRDSRGSGKMLSLPGLTIKKEYENLILTRGPASASIMEPANDKTLTFPGESRAGSVVVRTEIMDRSTFEVDSIKASDQTAYFALDRITLPLVLRGPRQGDRMRPFGMSGRKKLSDLFIDKKIAGRDRARSLVIADAEDIVWLVGVTTAEKTRVGPYTNKVVKITLARG